MCFRLKINVGQTNNLKFYFWIIIKGKKKKKRRAKPLALWKPRSTGIIENLESMEQMKLLIVI